MTTQSSQSNGFSIPKEPFLSPLNQRRLRNFRQNKRGWRSLIIFTVLFFLTLFAEFISNDRPIVASYKGELLFPFLIDYPEEKFGGFLALTDYRDPFVAKAIMRDGWMIWPPIRFSYDTIHRHLPTPAPSPPTWMLSEAQCEKMLIDGAAGRSCADLEWNWLGTDDRGRDVLARLIYGFRLSILFGFALSLSSSVIGVLAGAAQGYWGGKLDLFFQRGIEIWSSIPRLYLLITLSSFVIPGFWTLLLILLLFEWTSLVGVVRAEFLRARNFTYVSAARALGLPDRLIVLRHVLPNALVATLTLFPFVINGAISTLTSLDFLGFGLPPGAPSLGELLRQAKSNLQAPWLGIVGFFVIGLLLSLLTFIGEAVRDAFDPRKASL